MSQLVQPRGEGIGLSARQNLSWWNMAYSWKLLPHIQYPDYCLDPKCKLLIKVGEPAWWMKYRGIMHPNCGLGSKPGFTLHPIYKENPTYDGNPFENIHKHLPEFFNAKEWRASQE